MQLKIANVLLEDTRQFHQQPTLYVRTANAVTPADDGTWMLKGTGSFDFTTFFNGLSVIKWDEYTSAKGYVLHLELKGAACDVWQTTAARADYYSQKVESTHVALDASDEWHAIDIKLDYGPDAVICGFVIETKGTVELRKSYYSAEVEESDVRPVELALSNTTFKKESYIKHNIELVREKVLGSDERIAKHFRMYVVDNGRTLDAEALSGDGVTVFPNDNVGGSGGFTYGMIKALEAGDVTHILLMDDDVEVSPESFIRTYNLLSIVNEAHAEAFVEGAMMSFDDVDFRWEDCGYMTFAGIFAPIKPGTHIASLHECVNNEAFYCDPKSFADLNQRYGAWWFDCIPLSVIKREGLPLPFFVRFDDAEYGMRCHPKFMTMNGICVWHLAFDMRYNAAVERYQTMRNTFVGNAITGVAPMSNFMDELVANVTKEIVKFNYKDAELAVEAFEDFMKGPDTFGQKGYAEKRFMDANHNKEKMIPFSELAPQAEQELGVNIYDLTTASVEADIPMGGKPRGRFYNAGMRFRFRETLNGHVKASLKPFGKNYAIVDGRGWSYQPGRLFGVDTVLAVNMQVKQGIIRHRDNKRGKELWERLQKDIKQYHSQKDALEQAYRAARPRLTSVEYWKDYLNLD